ncbi:MAG TPA: RHS repeat protein, partial [Thiothrix sp.]|nr:RHS repeat protein [Thiothrix sp.]
MPIDIATGAIQHYAEDFSITGKVDLDWERYYDSQLRDTVSPLGFGWTCRYFCHLSVEYIEDGGHKEYAFTDAEGNVIIFADSDDQLKQGHRLVNLGAFSELHYLTDCYVITQWDNDSGEIWQYRFPIVEGVIRPLASLTEPSGQGVELAYNAQEQLVGIRQKLEKRTLILRYNAQNFISSIDFIYPDKQIQTLVSYDYDARGNLISITDAANQRDYFIYDKQHRLQEEQSKDGAVIRFRYDEFDRCIYSTGLGGYDEKTLSFIDNAGWVEVTDSEGAVWRYQYNENGQIAREINPLGAEEKTDYDAENRIVRQTNPNGASTEYHYDRHGNRHRIINALGQTTTIIYNHVHLPTQLTDSAGNTWNRVYDQNHRLIILEDPKQSRYHLQYDVKGNLTQITDPLGHQLRQQFNGRGVLQAATDWLGHIKSYQSDAFGRLTQITDPLGHRTAYQYDLMGNLISVVYADGTQNSYNYDAGGHLIHFTDRNQQVTEYQYGHCGRLLERRDALGRKLHFGWSNEPDRLETVTNAKSEVYHFIYDSAGQIRTEIGFDGRELQFEYDLAGQRIAFINGLGEQIDYQYDALGRLTAQTAPDTQARFVYDPAGFLQQASNNDSDIVFKRDILGHIIEETQNGHVLERDYSVTGDLTTLRSDMGLHIDYRFDANGLLQAFKVQGHDPLRLERDARGAEIRRDLPGQNQLHQQFDEMGRLQQQAVVTGYSQASQAFQSPRAIVKRDYHYDKAHLTGIKDVLRGETTYVYDPVERLTDVLRDRGIDEHFLYDNNDNLSHIEQDNQQAELNYDKGDRLASKNDTHYVYDQQGRLVEKYQKIADADAEDEDNVKTALWQYEWDSLDQLRAIIKPDGERWEYAYDPFGRRIEKTSSTGEQMAFIWDEDVVLHEVENKQLKAHWVFDPHSFAPLAKIEQDQFYSVITDHLGTPQELINNRGDIVWQTHYTAWGGIQEQRHNKVDCPVRFQGQWCDDESGLYYNRFRYYDVDIGHYLSADPIRILGGYNLYAYVKNPILWLDFFGLVAAPSTLPDEPGIYI